MRPLASRPGTFLVALLLGLSPAGPAALAQQPAPTPAPLPDIEFAADLHMDSIRFGSDPRTSVRLQGGPRIDTRHDVDRGTLADPVRPGRSYRGVTVRTTFSATLLDPAVETASTGLAEAPNPLPPNDEETP
jgi:hypothetical protein